MQIRNFSNTVDAVWFYITLLFGIFHLQRRKSDVDKAEIKSVWFGLHCHHETVADGKLSI
jgi:hypothetical protein